MINRDRKYREHKSVIVRTRKGSTVDCFHFATTGRNHTDIPSGAPIYATYDKSAERIEVNWNVGGDLFVTLYNPHPNGFDVVETVTFDKQYITEVTIQTDFKCLR